MMARLADAALFAGGVYVCLRLIAASYRAIDLWYTIRTAWPRVAAGIASWGALAGALAAALEDGRRTAFLAGMLSFLAFYLSLYVLRHLLLRRPAPLE
jgi:hypothetical protein